MKTIEIFCVMMLISTVLFSQGLSKKQLRHQADSVAFNNLQQLVNNKKFVFTASQMIPLSGPSVILTTDQYSVVVKNDSVFCDLPFYGRAFNVNPQEEGGFHFSEPVSEYKVKVIQKKKSVDIEINARKPNDFFKFYFSFAGKDKATLSLISNNRSSIAYWGEVTEIPEQKEH